MILPSKKLLSAVLDKDVIDMKISEGVPTILIYNYQYPFGMDSHMQIASGKINIYELMNLMKEWAYRKSALIITYKEGNFWIVDIPGPKKGEEHFWLDHGFKSKFHYWEKKEPDAVTKACEWVLAQQK